ncbi:Muskelin N-terminus-domain-containing protein [Obelidium mucronatum]|nr:Muskelin N-terminus-domain-containing protein [Obelidium mucronatum]
MNAGPAKTPAPPQVLAYDVAAWSSHSATYHPRHIKTNRPADQSSRWSSGSNNQLQHVTLKLDRIAVVQTITFGKYHKVHVCNLKEFKVYGGLSLNNMAELLHAGLRNDTEPETFSLKHKVNDVVFPCQYIKIVPHLAWGPNFNFSIWFVELKGLQQHEFVDKIHWNYVNRNYLDAFECLQNRTQLQLEDPLLTELHSCLVINGDFAAAEEIIQQGYKRNMFSEYVHEYSYKPEWRREGIKCVSIQRVALIYIFGGWDGQKDLSDFWSFNVISKQWTCISLDTRRMNGPGPRSCHKICFDPSSKSIYTMGRYVDPDNRPNVNLDGDFWRYDTVPGRWTKISSSTVLDGGPELIYDHQMIVDTSSQTMYVFGGRAIGPDAAQVSYSGLYSYHIPTNTWRSLRQETPSPNDHNIQLKSRIGHSMLLNPTTRELYIFAGQRNKDYLSDFYVYDIENDQVHEISRDYSKQGGPDAGFTQRATIDPALGEFYVLSGLQKDKNTTQESVKNSFWCYNIKKGKWTRVYYNENTTADYWSKMKDKEPCPRFAHQLVYDSVRRVQYMFGGNPGDPTNLNLRLDDLWELHLLRPNAEDVARRAKFRIRRQQFKEMCAAGNSLEALEFLKTHVSTMVNHADEQESKEFRDMTMLLFNWKKPSSTTTTMASSSSSSGGTSSFQLRSELYELLLDYFPTSMREPKGNLVDLVDLVPL